MPTEKPRMHLTEVAPPERAQHDDVILETIWVTQQSIRARSRVRDPLQLDTMYRKRQLHYNPYLAGLRVHWLFGIAGIRERLITRYEDALHRGDYQNSVARAGDAYHHWRKSMMIATPIAAQEVYKVCCMDQPAGGSIGMEILRRGLQLLFDRRRDWWGLTVDDSDLTMEGY